MTAVIAMPSFCNHLFREDSKGLCGSGHDRRLDQGARVRQRVAKLHTDTVVVVARED